MFETQYCFVTVFWDAELTFSFDVVPFEMDSVEPIAFISGDDVSLLEMLEKMIKIMLIGEFNAKVINH